MTMMSARRVMTASPPGRGSRASAASSRSVLWIHSSPGAPAPTTMIAGSARTRSRAAGCSRRTAPHTSAVGAPPPP